MADPVNIRAIVPRVRRAIEGVGQASVLTDDQVKDITADAVADVILYTGTVFGHELLVLVTDVNDIPEEYGTDGPLTLPEQSVIATQAALNHWFFVLVAQKASERIADEAREWEFSYSARLLRDALQRLVDERDRAIAAITAHQALGAQYISFLAVRDKEVARIVEPWTDPAQLVGGVSQGIGGQQLDPRFDQ